MKMPERGLLIVVSGPSGSGKGTVLAKVFARRQRIFYSVSATTRAPRPGEVDGKNYYFLTRQEFENRIARGDMLEHAEYCRNYYGTPRTAVEERLRQGCDVVLEIELRGAMQVKAACPDAVMIFIMPPSRAELERRLRGRGTENEEKIQNRLRTADEEMASASRYDYIVVNAQVAEAADTIDCIITAEKHRSSRFNGGNLNA